MSSTNRNDRWRISRSLKRVYWAILNGKLQLAQLNRPFPRETPAEWDDWLGAAIARIEANEEAELTDTAFKNTADMLAASEDVAAGVRVEQPSEDDLRKISEGLAKINEAVRADNGFHAALDIGVALAGEIEKLRA